MYSTIISIYLIKWYNYHACIKVIQIQCSSPVIQNREFNVIITNVPKGIATKLREPQNYSLYIEKSRKPYLLNLCHATVLGCHEQEVFKCWFVACSVLTGLHAEHTVFSFCNYIMHLTQAHNY